MQIYTREELEEIISHIETVMNMQGIYSREELEDILGHMESAINITDTLIQSMMGATTFRQFVGLMREYHKVCKCMTARKIQFPFLDGSQDLGILNEGNLTYIAEKFSRLFGVMFGNDAERRLFLEKLGWQHLIGPHDDDEKTILRLEE